MKSASPTNALTGATWFTPTNQATLMALEQDWGPADALASLDEYGCRDRAK